MKILVGIRLDVYSSLERNSHGKSRMKIGIGPCVYLGVCVCAAYDTVLASASVHASICFTMISCYFMDVVTDSATAAFHMIIATHRNVLHLLRLNTIKISQIWSFVLQK